MLAGTTAATMKRTIAVINQMQTDRIIGKYAIGGAIGATFYLEPKSTFDIDIFVSFEADPGRQLVSLDSIYEYLGRLGYKPQDEHIVIEGWHVQFLPANDPLYSEALAEAVETQIEGEKTWVMTAEHLMAIALKVGRPKDFDRIRQFINQAPVLAEAAITGSSSSGYGRDGGILYQPGNKVISMSQNKVYDEGKLNKILVRHKLVETWEKFKFRIASENERIDG
ncbi:MAG: hypothetical protein ABSA83_11010 [Verrucomicrobiota bacterium]|jgi:hypothetical protein